MIKNLRRVFALSMAAVMLTACSGQPSNNGGGSSNEPAPASNTVSDNSTDSVPETTTLSDRTIKVGMAGTLQTLSPFQTNASRDQVYFLQMYESLGVEAFDKEFKPWAAKSWTTEDNGITYHFEIWDNMVDSEGNKITAADVVWFIEESKARALKPNYNKVASVTQTGDYTFDVVFVSNIVGVLETFLQDTYIVSKAAFEASPDEMATMVVSTAPYKVTEFTSSLSMEFTRRDDYWAMDMLDKIPECVRPIQKVVSYQAIPEASQLGIAVETGQIDIANQVAISTGKNYVDNPEYTVLLQDGPQGYEMFFSGVDSAKAEAGYVTADKVKLVADNEKLRQALCYAIDQKGLIAGLSNGYAVEMYDVCPTTAIGYLNKWVGEDYMSYDLEKAQQLVKESGYNGEELSLLCSSSSTMSLLAQLLQNMWKAAGINVKLDIRDAAGFMAVRLDGTEYDMMLNTIGAVTLTQHWQTRYDQEGFQTNGYACDATGRHDEELKALIDKAWTVDGYTDANIDAVHSYLRDHAIAYGLVDEQVFSVWKSSLGMKKIVLASSSRHLNPASCQFD